MQESGAFTFPVSQLLSSTPLLLYPTVGVCSKGTTKILVIPNPPCPETVAVLLPASAATPAGHGPAAAPAPATSFHTPPAAVEAMLLQLPVRGRCCRLLRTPVAAPAAAAAGLLPAAVPPLAAAAALHADYAWGPWQHMQTVQYETAHDAH